MYPLSLSPSLPPFLLSPLCPSLSLSLSLTHTHTRTHTHTHTHTLSLSLSLSPCSLVLEESQEIHKLLLLIKEEMEEERKMLENNYLLMALVVKFMSLTDHQQQKGKGSLQNLLQASQKLIMKQATILIQISHHLLPLL